MRTWGAWDIVYPSSYICGVITRVLEPELRLQRTFRSCLDRYTCMCSRRSAEWQRTRPGDGQKKRSRVMQPSGTSLCTFINQA